MALIKLSSRKQKFIFGFTVLFLTFSAGLGLWFFDAHNKLIATQDYDRKTTEEVLNNQPNPNLKKPHLIIPSISVATFIQNVGLTADGDMGVPTSADEAGWYKYGPKPGEKGNSVIAGHVDTGKGSKAGIFWDLDKLRPGDSIFVVNQEDQTLHFKVTSKASYTPENAPLEKIFGSNEKSSLNLITCEGRWDSSTRSYSHRLVVFTELVEQEDSS